MDEHNELIQKRIRNGHPVAVFENQYVTVIANGQRVRIAPVSEIPLTQNGDCRFMVANVLAGVLAAYCWGFSTEVLQEALRTFIPSYELTPGRMNLFEFKDYKVLVDYAHNPHGFLALQDYLSHTSAKRKIGIIAGIGDRRDEDTLELARIAAGMFDHIIVRQEHSLRGRTASEINNLIVEGVRSVTDKVTVELIPEETAAIQQALAMARPGDFIVALSDGHQRVVDIITAQLQMEKLGPAETAGVGVTG